MQLLNRVPGNARPGNLGRAKWEGLRSRRPEMERLDCSLAAYTTVERVVGKTDSVQLPKQGVPIVAQICAYNHPASPAQSPSQLTAVVLAARPWWRCTGPHDRTTLAISLRGARIGISAARAKLLPRRWPVASCDPLDGVPDPACGLLGALGLLVQI
jgi:hypothetical protein